MNRLSKFLLATTCLTAASAAPAYGVPEVEPNSSFATPQLLPPGTTQVDPANFFGVDEDFYKLILLQPGAFFSATINSPDSTAILTEQGFSARTSSGATIQSQNSVANGTTVSGIIPPDGILILDALGTIPNLELGPYHYSLNINAPPLAPVGAVPEPTVVSLMASGLAALGALGARWKKRPTS